MPRKPSAPSPIDQARQLVKDTMVLQRHTGWTEHECVKFNLELMEEIKLRNQSKTNKPKE
jgi:hypothetical protein